LAKTENTFISAVTSGHYYVACLWLFSPWVVLVVIYLGRLKVVISCNVM